VSPRESLERWPLLPTLGLFALAWLALSWPWLAGTVTIPWDAKAHFYPQLQFMAQSLARGEQPFWTPFVFSGSPQIADPQSLIFSPPFLALALLDPDPGFQAADAMVLGMLGLGGIAVILFFRDRGWHPAGALVAALAFAFGGSAAWRIQHIGQILSLAYLPIAIWLLARALERRSVGYGLLAGLVGGIMAVGRDQVAYLGLWVLVGFVIWHWMDGENRWRTLRASLVPVLASALVAALVAAVPVALSMLLAEVSNRAAVDYAGAGRASLHPALLLTAFVPNLFGAAGPLQDHWGPPSPLWGPVDLFLARNMGQFYLGALPIAALATAVLLRRALWAREVRFFTAAATVMLLYALGRYTPFFRAVFDLVPGVGLFRRPADATFVLGFLAAVLSGYVVHRWCEAGDVAGSVARRLVPVFMVLAPFALCFAIAVQKNTFALAAGAISSAALFLALALTVIALLPRLAARSATLAALAVTAAMGLDLALNNGPNESTALPPATYDVLRPDSRDPILQTLKARVAETTSGQRLDRVELAGLGFHWPNASLVHRLHNTLGYNPVRLGIYTAATGAGDQAALPDQRTFSPLFPSYRSTLADLLGLRFLATGVPVERIDPKIRSGDLKLVAQTKEGFVYENPRAGPRVSFATEARPADFDALLHDGTWPAIDFATTVLVPPDAALPEARPATASTPNAVRIVTYRNTEILIDVETASSGYLVLYDPWHPWWFASIDGRSAPILRANVLFRTVPVPAGRHTVRFEFRPLAGAWRQIEARIPWVEVPLR
jgi:hypothetical protein